MDRGLCRVPDTQPTTCPLAPITLSCVCLSSVIFTPTALSLCCGTAQKHHQPFQASRWDKESRGLEHNLSQASGLSFESCFIFFHSAHSSGFHKSTGSLRTAFSRAVGGLAQHNQGSITGRQGETEGGRG